MKTYTETRLRAGKTLHFKSDEHFLEASYLNENQGLFKIILDQYKTVYVSFKDFDLQLASLINTYNLEYYKPDLK